MSNKVQRKSPTFIPEQKVKEVPKLTEYQIIQLAMKDRIKEQLTDMYMLGAQTKDKIE